jgi:hypothetical protein
MNVLSALWFALFLLFRLGAHLLDEIDKNRIARPKYLEKLLRVPSAFDFAQNLTNPSCN